METTGNRSERKTVGLMKDINSLAQGKYNKGKSPSTISAYKVEMSISYCV